MTEGQQANVAVESAAPATEPPRPRMFAGVRMMLVDFHYWRKHWLQFDGKPVVLFSID